MTKQEKWQAMLSNLRITSTLMPWPSEMILDLSKPMKELPGALSAPVKSSPQLPVPPPLRHVDGRGCPVTLSQPTAPSRFWCFFGVHKFEIQKETTWQITNHGEVWAKGPMYILRCHVCGKMKAERLGKGT